VRVRVCVCMRVGGDGRLLVGPVRPAIVVDEQISRSSCYCIFRPVFDAPLRRRHRNQTRHRDVMWTVVLLCACATAAAVTSLSDLDGDGTPGQSWVDDRVSGHPVGYIGRRHEFLTLCPVLIYCP